MSTMLAPRHQPTISTFDPYPFDPSHLSLHPSQNSIGSRFEVVPHEGPGTAIYVCQPSRSELKANNAVFGSHKRPFYFRDSLNKPFIDIDGKVCGPRWVFVDPRAGEPAEQSKGCSVM